MNAATRGPPRRAPRAPGARGSFEQAAFAADAADPAQPSGTTERHQLTLLKGGAALFDALVEAIDTARAEVRLETYIMEIGGAVVAVAEALERAGARGVKVNIVVDGIGTPAIAPEWEARWRSAGVEWRIFNPARGWRMLFPKGWRRMHRKLCVVDARVAFCGGINLLDDFVDPNHGPLAAPRLDFAVRATGPLVADVHETMTRLWLRMEVVREVRHFDYPAALQAVREAAGVGADMTDPAIAEDLAAASGQGGHARVQDAASAYMARPATGTDSAKGPLAVLALRDNLRFRNRIERTYRFAIGQAKSEILIANAYFVPGVKLQRALLRAAKRGVRITLLLQGRYEYFMQHHTSRALYGVLLDAGIEIIEYRASFLHAKVAVMDGVHGAMSTVGSSNLDPLSLLLAREANIFVRDDAFAAELRAHLMNAIASEGKRIESSAHLKRSLRTRSLSWIAYGLMRIALFATRNRY